MNINVPNFAVRDSSGEVLIDETVEKFRVELLRFKANRETETAQIAMAVNAVFDQHLGVSITMPAVVSMTLTRLDVTPETFNLLRERTMDFIRANASAKREDGMDFCVQKGKHGGVFRWVDKAE